MNALLHPFLAAFLAEWGDRTQLLAMMLALRYRGSRAILPGIALAALLNALFAAFCGSLLVTLINHQAITLMTALALLAAGGGALLPQRPPKLITQDRGKALICSFLAFGILGFGDKTQFLTLSLAAHSNAVWLPAIGAAAGVVAANAPAILLGDRLPAQLPLRSIRIGAGLLLLISGAIAALSALRLF